MSKSEASRILQRRYDELAEAMLGKNYGGVWNLSRRSYDEAFAIDRKICEAFEADPKMQEMLRKCPRLLRPQREGAQ